jgi:hypothetical protein
MNISSFVAVQRLSSAFDTRPHEGYFAAIAAKIKCIVYGFNDLTNKMIKYGICMFKKS